MSFVSRVLIPQARPLAAAVTLLAVVEYGIRFAPRLVADLLRLPIPPRLDFGVVALLIPLCALLLALLAEAARLIQRGDLPDSNRPQARSISHWADNAY